MTGLTEIRPTIAASTAVTLLRPQAGAEADPAEKSRRLAQLKKACGDIESFFASELVKSLNQAASLGGLADSAPGSDMYGSMAQQQLAMFLAQGQGLGLGQMIFDQVVRKENLTEAAAVDSEAGGLKARQVVSPDRLPSSGLRPAIGADNSPKYISGDILAGGR